MAEKRRKKELPGLRRLVGTVRTALQFRQDTASVAWLANQLSQPQFREVLQILDDMSPSRGGVLAVGATEADLVQAYGMIQGYQRCLNTLQSLAEPLPADDPEPTFEEA